MVRVRIHGRGGQGAKTASKMLGDAAFAEGLHVQDFPLYGAERRGAPVEAFTRISDREIEERGYIFDPDVVAVMDESLMEDPLAKPLDGAREGAVVLVNTTKPVEKLPIGRADLEVVAMDLTGESLRTAGRPILSSPVAAALGRILGMKESSVLGAVVGELRDLAIPEQVIARNLQLAKEVFGEVSPVALETKEVPGGVEMASLDMVMKGGEFEDITSPGNSAQRRTGDWRVFKPVIDYGKCTTCMVCYVYCPESAIVMNAGGKVEVDYDNCKGCMICMTECPVKAITELREGELD